MQRCQTCFVLVIVLGIGLLAGCGEPPAGPVADPGPEKSIDPKQLAAEGNKAIASKRDQIRNAPNLSADQKAQALRMLGER